MQLTSELLAGSRIALARVLTQIENDTPQGRHFSNELFPYAGNAHLIGVTGAPGTGKSSLVNRLAIAYRKPTQGQPKRVGIVAVDPSSPFTGGAILGDRVRMRDLSGDPGVFIRSMATRGSLGGLATATSGVVQAMDAAGFEIILVETVGAGQAEVEIARLAHTTIVVEAPGLGDDIQAIKAGILEIADILVINKADRPGVESTERALRSMLQLAHPSLHIFQDNLNKPGHHGQNVSSNLAVEGKDPAESRMQLWETPIIRTVATEGIGISELQNEISRYYENILETRELARRNQSRLKSELDILLRETLVARWQERVPESIYMEIIDRLNKREISRARRFMILLQDNQTGGNDDLRG